MNQIARITKRTHCSLLEGNRILNKKVEFKGLGDFHPGPNGPVFDAETVLMTDCNKNFVFYWLKPFIFPKVHTILLDSHPCEYSVLHRFPNANLILPERYGGYKRRWAKDNENVSILYDGGFEMFSSSHETESLCVVAKH